MRCPYVLQPSQGSSLRPKSGVPPLSLDKGTLSIIRKRVWQRRAEPNSSVPARFRNAGEIVK